MTKITLGFLALAMCAGTAMTAAPAKAEVIYPWCAIYAGPDGDGGKNCGFVNLQQCLVTVSGIGGSCYENPAYPGIGTKPIRRVYRNVY